MLTFFRRLRNGFLGSGKTQKYFLYAMGEILLVVIGILIALQINNWNEWRKDRTKERIVLQDLLENLESNIDILESSIERIKDQHNSSQLVFSFFKNEIPYADSLDRHFFLAILMGALQGTLTDDGYASFQNAGFDLVRSEPLKKQIIRIFEVTYQGLEEWREMLISNGSVLTEFRYSHFVHHESGMKPQDIRTIADSKTAQSVFYNVYIWRNILLSHLNMCLEESRAVAQLIEEELQGT